MVEDWISLRQFAIRRGMSLKAVQKAIEAGRVTAVKRDASGRLAAIDFVAASKQWDQNTDELAALRNGKFPGAGAEFLAPEIAAEQGAAPGAGISPETPAGRSGAAAGAIYTPAIESGALFPPAAGGQGGSNTAEIPSEAAGGAEIPAASGGGRDPHGYLAARAEREKFAAKQQELDYMRELGQLVSADQVKKLSARRYRAIRDALLNIPDRVAAVLAAERDPAQVHAQLTTEIKRVLHELSDDARAEAARESAVGVAA